jgi:plasmid stability protein
MPQLMLRDVDFALIRLLKQRAAKNGRSPEAEHLAILEQVLRGDSRPMSVAGVKHMFRALGIDDGGEAPRPGPRAVDSDT